MSEIANINRHIDKIEDALNQLSQNPKGGWTDLMKSWGVPYYGNITAILRKRGIAIPKGTGLEWVGDKPTRTVAALIYEEAKEASSKGRARFKNKNKDVEADTPASTKQQGPEYKQGEGLVWKNPEPQITDNASPDILIRIDVDKEVFAPPSEKSLRRALAIMEKAMWHKVPDPVAFTLDVLKDGRI